MEMTAKMFFPLILMDISMTHFLMTQQMFFHDSTHSSPSFPIYPIIHTMSQTSSLIVIHFYSYNSFSVLHHHFSMAVLLCLLRLHVMTHFYSFLTHIILHAGRIFWQQHHNHIVCLVVETALHVYKGQFHPWLGQFTSIHWI